MVCICVIVSRVTQPDLKRPFKMPFKLLLPVLGILSCGLLMVYLPLVTWQRFGIWLAIGLGIYFSYSMRNSRLAKASPASS